MRANGSRARRMGFTLIELLVVISIIVILATIAITALAGVMGQQQEKNAVSMLKIMDSSVNSYRKLYGRWPLDLNYIPPIMTGAAANGLSNGELNKNILKNLRHDWSQGNFDAFPEDQIKIDKGDGLQYFCDPWQRPYQFKVQTVMKGGKEIITQIYFYSMGEDGADDFTDLQTWLATPGASWPPADTYQNDLRSGTPTSPNIDNIYPTGD